MYSFVVMSSPKVKGFTYLSSIFAAIKGAQEYYNWIISDVSCNYYPDLLNFSAPLLLSGKELTAISLLNDEPQFIWGVFSGIPIDKQFNIKGIDEMPYAENNSSFWKEDYKMQIPSSEIEIVAFDSSFFIFSTSQKEIADDFCIYFEGATKLEDYIL